MTWLLVVWRHGKGQDRCRSAAGAVVGRRGDCSHRHQDPAGSVVRPRHAGSARCA